ncbi:hypothetical protein HZB05_02855 [Candidatus Wolfebacteria bacterium]|nr:hypothetical protein [Candidatus Wolfebacteria bacterium]
MINKEEIKKLKTKLEEEKAELEKEVAELKVVPDFGSDVDASDEETDESQAYGNQLALMQTFKERLADIEFALDKMEKGTYGVCEKCGKEISLDVLEVDPESKLCREDKKKGK